MLKGEVAELLTVADRRHYADAIALRRRIQRISVDLDRPDEFRDYAAEIRADNSRRPAFCSMFDAAGIL